MGKKWSSISGSTGTWMQDKGKGEDEVQGKEAESYFLFKSIKEGWQ